MTSFYFEHSPIEDRFPPEAREKPLAPPPLYDVYTRDARYARFTVEDSYNNSFKPPDENFNSDSETLRIIDHQPHDEDTQWVTGWKLTSLMISITLACFLLLLDMSIIVTVRLRSTN